MLLLEQLDGKKMPILADFDCCHTHPMHPLAIGKKIRLDATAKKYFVLKRGCRATKHERLSQKTNFSGKLVLHLFKIKRKLLNLAFISVSMEPFFFYPPDKTSSKAPRKLAMHCFGALFNIYSRGSTASLSSANVASTHSCMRAMLSFWTKRSMPSKPRANSCKACFIFLLGLRFLVGLAGAGLYSPFHK